MKADGLPIVITAEHIGDLTNALVNDKNYPRHLKHVIEGEFRLIAREALATGLMAEGEMKLDSWVKSVLSHNDREAVCINDVDETLQLSTRNRTPRSSTRHGRMGVISIIRKIISSRMGTPVSYADIARYALSKNAESHDGGEGLHDALRKSLERLDAGAFVSVSNLQLVTNALCLDLYVLCFLSSTTAKAARKERAANVAKRENALRRHPVQLIRLEASWPDVSRWTAKRWQRAIIKPATSKGRLSKEACSRLGAKLAALIAAPPRSKAMRRLQWEAIVATLDGHSACVWYGYYDDVIPLHGNSVYMRHSAMSARGEEVGTDVFVISANDRPPRLEVNLAHTLRLRPTAADVAREFS